MFKKTTKYRLRLAKIYTTETTPKRQSMPSPNAFAPYAFNNDLQKRM